MISFKRPNIPDRLAEQQFHVLRMRNLVPGPDMPDAFYVSIAWKNTRRIPACQLPAALRRVLRCLWRARRNRILNGSDLFA